MYPTREGAARQARAAYANGYVGKSLAEIRKSSDDRKSLATGVGGTATAAGLGGTGIFVVRAKGHQKLLRNQIASEKEHAGKKTTLPNHYQRGEGVGKIVPEQHILRHLKRGRAATIGLAGGGAALTAYGLRRKPVEKADRDRRRSGEIAAMGSGASIAGGGYGLARMLEGQGNKWAARSAAKLDEAKKIAPQLGGWTEGKSNSRVRYVKPDLPSKNTHKHPELLEGMSRKKIERVGELRGAAGQHGHFAKIYGDIARQSRRYAVPAGVAVGAAGAGSMALRSRRDRMSKAMTKDEKKKATATGVGAVGIGAGLVGGGIPGAKADSRAGRQLFPHLPEYQSPTVKDLFHRGPIQPRVEAAARMGRGGIFGYRDDAHARFLRRQTGEVPYKDLTTRSNIFLRGQGAGKVAPEKKIIRHMRAGRKASYGLLAGGAGLTAYGTHKKKEPVGKASDAERRSAALGVAGGTIAGGSYGAARLLEHQGRKWASQSAQDIEAARKIIPELGGWTEGSRKNKRIPNVKPDLSNKDVENRRRNIFHNYNRSQTEKAGKLRGSAAQGRYFSGVYGVNARRIRRIGIPAGLAAGAAGAGGVALSRRKEKVGKAYQPTYFGGSVPTERLQAQRQRTRTEAHRAALQGASVGLAGGSAAALGARWLGNDAAPAAVRAAGVTARHQGVPKATVKDLTHRADKVHAWARNKRGRLLAASAAAAAGAGAARIGARWKKDEVVGISQDLGRASAGDRLQAGSRQVTKGIGTALVGSYGVKAAKKWASLDPKTRNRIVTGTLVGTTTAGAGGSTAWAVNRSERWRKEKNRLKAEGGASGPVMKSEEVGKGTRDYEYLPENIRQDVGYGSIGPRRNPMSALDLFASSRIMAAADAKARGERLSRRRLNRRAYHEMNYAGARTMLYSPVGRGSVF